MATSPPVKLAFRQGPLQLPRISPYKSPEDSEKYTLSDVLGYRGITAVTGFDVKTRWSHLQPDGVLILFRGYRWDGPSGPAVDTLLTMMPSALHDELYRMRKLGLIPKNTRRLADYTYRDALKTWGVPTWRRALHFRAVFHFGGLYSRVK